MVGGAPMFQQTVTDFFLEEIARKQWQADVVGGAVADRQLKETDQKLKAIGFTRSDLLYRIAYDRAQSRIT